MKKQTGLDRNRTKLYEQEQQEDHSEFIGVIGFCFTNTVEHIFIDIVSQFFIFWVSFFLLRTVLIS